MILQTATNNYGDALLAKAAAGSQSSGQAVLAEINVSIDEIGCVYACANDFFSPTSTMLLLPTTKLTARIGKEIS